MSDYLYKKFSTLREMNVFNVEIPKYVIENINDKFTLRKYQIEAFQNFIYYFEQPTLRKKPSHLLFHMATGSGKTLMMAGLIIYLYKQGYRDFLFFVNSKNIIEKTKDNFLNCSSSKYLFDQKIVIDGKKVSIKEVTNFQECNDTDINICFSTIQGLHMDINFTKENHLSIDDFENRKIVMISDEAHHLNSITGNGKLDKSEKELLQSWEYTVNRILASNNENVLLEFTATCDIENPNIASKYLDKMIYNYPLSKFREDKYSKEVDTLQSNCDMKTKMLQAILLSQYRLKLFQDYKINIKPVVLFKSDTIDNSKNNLLLFNEIIDSLKEEDIYKIKESTNNELLMDMFIYYENNDITISNLIREIKEDFGKSKCISVNDDNEACDVQLVVNSLEDKNNNYRAIFEVKKLDEGWDVLNLFDIVRLYETRDPNKGKPGKKTVQEAQLIGRGARYCPFILDNEDEKYTRKFDDDIEHPLRLCETLLYHCQNDSKYISELKIALKKTGIMPEDAKKINYKIKDSFKRTDFYKTGLVFFNKKIIKDRSKVTCIPQSVRDEIYTSTFNSGRSKSLNLFEDEKIDFRNVEEKLNSKNYKFKEIKKINKNIILSNMRKIEIYKFNTLQSYFPNLKSIDEFISSDDYLGNITVNINSVLKEPTIEMINESVFNVLNKIKDKILVFDETYEGTKEFYSIKFNEVFKDKVSNIQNPGNDSVGISQNDVEDDSYKLDLSDKEWYVFNDNYGTTEEKKFVKYFSTYVDEFEEKYDSIFLVRNERFMPIYSFDSGERFEPDYLLIILDKDSSQSKQYQVFIEPKGSHLLLDDKWKEDLLVSLAKESIPTTKFVDNNEYLIWGFPFFNKDNKMEEFENALKELLD